MNPRTPWRREELALLESWSGTDAELAQQLGRSAQAIRNQRWRRTNPDALIKQRAYAQGRGARLAYIRGRIQREQLNAYARPGQRQRARPPRILVRMGPKRMQSSCESTFRSGPSPPSSAGRPTRSASGVDCCSAAWIRLVNAPDRGRSWSRRGTRARCQQSGQLPPRGGASSAQRPRFGASPAGAAEVGLGHPRWKSRLGGRRSPTTWSTTILARTRTVLCRP